MIFPVFIMMIGLPGSGKSTIAKDYNIPVFSSDKYRERLLGDVNDQSANDKIFKELYKDIKDCLQRGSSCVFDATNISRKSRTRVMQMIKGITAFKMAHVVCPPWATVIKQNAERDRVVPFEVLERMIRQFEFPQLFEGFDNIVVTNQYDSSYEKHLADLVTQMSEFDQHNPHHIYTLGEHCIRVAHKFPPYDIRNEAGYYHDVGKLYTCRFDDNGVAHYYNHDNIGAYIVASYTKWKSIATNRNLMKIFFINYHMRAHNDFRTPKAERKYRAIFGNDLFDRLQEFAEADKEASSTYKGTVE